MQRRGHQTHIDTIIFDPFESPWRIGPQPAPHEPEAVAKESPAISDNLDAAVAAFDCYDELDSYVANYARNREILLRALPLAGFDRLAPADGAFYIYAEVSRLTNDSADYCKRMLAETGVAATPGVDFDPARGHRFVRFSFARSEADISAAAERLRNWSHKT